MNCKDCENYKPKSTNPFKVGDIVVKETSRFRPWKITKIISPYTVECEYSSANWYIKGECDIKDIELYQNESNSSQHVKAGDWIVLTETLLDGCFNKGKAFVVIGYLLGNTDIPMIKKDNAIIALENKDWYLIIENGFIKHAK